MTTQVTPHETGRWLLTETMLPLKVQTAFCLALRPRCHTHHAWSHAFPSCPCQLLSTAAGVVCNCIASLECVISVFSPPHMLPSPTVTLTSHWALGPLFVPSVPLRHSCNLHPHPPSLPTFSCVSEVIIYSPTLWGWSSCILPKASDSLPHPQTYPSFSHLFLLGCTCLSFLPPHSRKLNFASIPN